MTSAAAGPTISRTICAISIKASTIIRVTQHATPTDVAQMRGLSPIIHLAQRSDRICHKQKHLRAKDPWIILQELQRRLNRASQTLYNENLLHQTLSLKHLLNSLIVESTQRQNLPDGCPYIPMHPRKLQMLSALQAGACDLTTSLLLQPQKRLQARR